MGALSLLSLNLSILKLYTGGLNALSLLWLILSWLSISLLINASLPSQGVLIALNLVIGLQVGFS